MLQRFSCIPFIFKPPWCFRTATTTTKAHLLNLKKITQGRLKLKKKGKYFAFLTTFFFHKCRILKVAAVEVL